MNDAGFGSDSKNGMLVSMMIIAILMCVGNFICISVSQKFGRRQLILWCTIPMSISLSVLAAVIIINNMFTNGGFSGKCYFDVFNNFSK
jgi:hypothetical protein